MKLYKEAEARRYFQRFTGTTNLPDRYVTSTVTGSTTATADVGTEVEANCMDNQNGSNEEDVCEVIEQTKWQ